MTARTFAAYIPPEGVTTPCYKVDHDAYARRTWADEWYPKEKRHTEFAQSLCRQCPVQLDCGEWAMRHERGLPVDERHGVWGGLAPADRARLDRGEAA